MNAELAVLRETIDEAGRGLAELEKSGSTVASDAAFARCSSGNPSASRLS